MPELAPQQLSDGAQWEIKATFATLNSRRAQQLWGEAPDQLEDGWMDGRRGQGTAHRGWPAAGESCFEILS